MTRQPEVFISYARRESRDQVDALQAALGGPSRCFVDRSNIEALAEFPVALRDAMLGARVVVAVLGPAYLKSGYCWKEWLLALGPFLAVRRRRLDEAAQSDALRHVVPLLQAGAGEESRMLLVGPMAAWNLPRADETAVIAATIEGLLAARPPTLDELIRDHQVDPALREILTDRHHVAQLPQRQGRVPCYPIRQGDRHASIGADFIGRTDDFQRLFWTLAAGAHENAAALTTSVVGHGGYGKTRLALEYLHRLGPLLYPGGNILIDASGTAEGRPLGDQLREVDRLLRDRHADLGIPTEGDARDSLAVSLAHVGQSRPILWVIDNLPDQGSVGELADYCPAAKEVAIVITTRRAVDWPGVSTLALDVLGPDEAVALLKRRLGTPARGALSRPEWLALAEAVGRLPLVLEILNAALVEGLDEPRSLLDRIGRDDPAALGDELCGELRDLLPERSLRGVVEVFRVSLEGLEDEDARELLLRLAWLAPATLPVPLLNALAPDPKRHRAALVRLNRCSWLPAAEAADARQLHRVLAAYLRLAQGEDEGRERLVAVASRLHDLMKSDEAWPEPPLDFLSQIRPHLEALMVRAEAAADWDVGEPAWEALRFWDAALLNRAGDLLGLFPSPEDLIRQRSWWPLIESQELGVLAQAWFGGGCEKARGGRRSLELPSRPSPAARVQARSRLAFEGLEASDQAAIPPPGRPGRGLHPARCWGCRLPESRPGPSTRSCRRAAPVHRKARPSASSWAAPREPHSGSPTKGRNGRSSSLPTGSAGRR
ncbi:MAG: toll/interleukin-1 receptor domain-containing protein [Planctomycetes bacterium]|nr:toll/interleukin-1 receptor domain-containing protein [Planctomycetota bacterium]